MGFEEIWRRIKSETNISNFRELSEAANTTYQYVSRKKKSDEFPVTWAYNVARKFNLSTEWILTGEGPKILSLTNEKNTGYKKRNLGHKEDNLVTERRSSYELLSEEKQTEDRIFSSLRDWIAELTRENPKRIYWFECILEDKITEYREWVENKKADKQKVA